MDTSHPVLQWKRAVQHHRNAAAVLPAVHLHDREGLLAVVTAPAELQFEKDGTCWVDMGEGHRATMPGPMGWDVMGALGGP